MRALAIAATGMSAQEQNIEVIANNIANINTTGFKRSRAEFTDLIYQTERLMGVSSRGRDATVPEGAQIGLGVRTAAIRSVNIQGSLTNTGNTLDLAINGRGWFQVTTANGDTVYTRDGAFNTNAHGPVGDRATAIWSRRRSSIPANRHVVTVSQTGLVTATISGPDDAADARPADDRQFRQRGRPAGAWRQSVPADARPPGRPMSACPATPLSASSSRAIWKPPTSIRSPRSPI